METTFLVIFTFSFLFFQTYGATTSSNVTCIKRERESLLVFRQGLIDESNRLSTWTGVECCEWHGVGCDVRNGHVVKLDLRTPSSSFMDDGYTLNTTNWLGGEVSPSLLNLKYLRYLDLSMNDFSGQNIPEFFGSFKYLEYLNLSCSGFSGLVPPHLGNLSRLQYLDLNLQYEDDMVSLPYYVSLMVKDDLRWVSLLSSLKHLDFSGIYIGSHIDWFHPINMLPSLVTLNLVSCDINNIPSTKFINFTSLKSLDLSFNAINSTMPVWLSNLTGLVHLNLAANSFHGRIPDSIGTLSSLASIKLSSNQFNTSMPDLFWNLSSLVSLELSYNNFYGSFSSNVKLCKLSILDLSSNKFVGDLVSFIEYISSDCLHNSLKFLSLGNNNFNGSIPDNIGEFKKLESLYLRRNTLSGPIPDSIGLLLRLQDLDLSYNQLSGNIPTSIVLLSHLKYLDLSYNQLSGNIPTSLGQLSNLHDLDLTANSLDGVLSEIHFTKLHNLTILSLSGNSLTFSVSSHWIPPFQLQQFYADSCNIGPQFPNWLQTSTKLEGLDLSNSSIVDRMPGWFENISSHIEFLDLSHNQIHGNLPRFDLNGSSISRTLNMKSNRFEGSLTSFPSDVTLLDLSDNLLSGSIASHLCKLLSIQVLALSNNKFSGKLPECLGNLTYLEAIDFANNTITGVVPDTLGFLSELRSLHLQNNRLEGVLPVSLQNLSELVTMDLGNNLFKSRIPFQIGQNMSKLRFLNLQSNKFSGSIPQQMCQLTELQYLNLANNNINGTIPHCFRNLRGMIIGQGKSEYIAYSYEENILASMKGKQLHYTKTIWFLTSLDLSSNKIVGKIPDVLINLVALRSLNLSGNLLKGEIPIKVGNLKQLESLDLSINKLSGGIPPGLTSLNFLSYLNLSFNNFSGPIPAGNQLQTLDDPSIYEGNEGLCGPPLSRSCKGNNLSYTRTGADEVKDDTEALFFYTGIGTGFVVGFVGLIGSLHFIRVWRVAYFEMMENIFAWVMISVLVTISRLRKKFFS